MRRFLALPVLVGLLYAQPAPELVVSVGDAGEPSLAAFVGDRYLATASASDVAIIDISSGLTVAHLQAGSHVMALQPNPGADLLAVSTCRDGIQLWDVRSRTLRHRLAPTAECPDSVSFSPDGAFLAAANYGCRSNKAVLVWDVRSATVAKQLPDPSSSQSELPVPCGPAHGARKVVFSGDGRWLVGVDDNGIATVFEWPSGRLVRRLEGLDGAGVSEFTASASPDGKYLAWLGSHGLQVWGMTTGARVPLPGAREVHIRDLPPGGVEREWSEQQVTALAAQFLNDGRLAYVDEDRLVVLALPNGAVHVVPLPRPGTEWSGDVGITSRRTWLTIRRDGLLLAGAYESRTVLWDVATRQFRDVTSPTLTEANSLQWNRSGVIAWADLDSGLRGWNDRSGGPVDFGPDARDGHGLVLRPDGLRLAMPGYESIRILDVARRRAIASVDVPVALEKGVGFSPDGARLAFASAKGLEVFDAALRPLFRLAPLEPYTSAEHVSFSPDGRWIAAGLGGSEPSLRVWPSGGPGAGITLDASQMTYGPQPPAFSADSRRLASFRQGESVVIWETGSWSMERTWSLPGTGRALAFAPAGSRLAVAGDGEAAIWDAGNGRKVVALSSPASPNAEGIAWSPDGRRVVTAADDGVLRFWDASDGRLLASLFVLSSSSDWLLVAPDGRLDGSERAVRSLIAWRVGDRVIPDRTLTERHRVPRLWRALMPGARDHR